MNFNYIESNDLINDYLHNNNLSLDDINKEYSLDINEDCINSFYNKILEFKDKKFLIVGDYDADGICSLCIIKRLFNELHINNNFYIPSRYKEGYGLNKNIVDNAIKYKYDCILLLDNGVSCKDSINYAYDNNIKVFIIDHHNYDVLPRCEAIIHQNLLSTDYSFCSAGELCLLLSLKHYMDDYSIVLGALTILSDYIYISKFNRFLLKKMIKILNNNDFMPLIDLNESNLFTYYSVSFNIIPKINSVSRLDNDDFNANHVVKYLLDKEYSKYIYKINEINTIRKTQTQEIYNQINFDDDKEYILYVDRKLNEGFCSSLCTRISNSMNKTTFVFSFSNGVYKGSCRSQYIDIYSLLKPFEHYDSFGGHEHAVGISIKEEYFVFFKQFISTIDYKKNDNTIIDVYLLDENDINIDLYNSINSLEPFGNGFNSPLIGIKNNDYNSILIKDKYTKFIINDKFSCITFDSKYVDYKPKYIIGYLKKDSFKNDAISLNIQYLE